MGPRPRRAGDDLARRLHHPREVPGSNQRGLRTVGRPAEPDARAVLPGSARQRATGVAARGHGRGRPSHPDPRVRFFAGVLRRLPPGTRAGQPDPGPTASLRLAPLSPHRPRRRLPHALGAGRERSPDRLGRSWRREPGAASPTGLCQGHETALARPQPGDQLLSRRELVARHADLPEARVHLDGHRLFTVVGASHLVEDLAQPRQQPLVLAHVSQKRFSGVGYRLTSSRASTKARTARSSSSREWAAETWVRIRALPWGTTGKEKPTT